MRVLMILVLLALAGCTESAQESPDVSENTDAAPAGPTPTEGGQTDANATSLLAIVACPLEEIPVMTGAGVGGVTTTSCDFEDLEIPDGAASLVATFTWDAAAEYEELGIKSQDTSDCSAEGGDGCNLGDAFGASPVTLRLDASALEGRAWEDLRIYPAGFAAQPDWALELAFFAADVPPAAF